MILVGDRPSGQVRQKLPQFFTLSGRCIRENSVRHYLAWGRFPTCPCPSFCRPPAGAVVSLSVAWSTSIDHEPHNHRAHNRLRLRTRVPRLEEFHNSLRPGSLRLAKWIDFRLPSRPAKSAFSSNVSRNGKSHPALRPLQRCNATMRQRAYLSRRCATVARRWHVSHATTAHNGRPLALQTRFFRRSSAARPVIRKLRGCAGSPASAGSRAAHFHAGPRESRRVCLRAIAVRSNPEVPDSGYRR